MVGKQLQIAMNEADEKDFVSFLRSVADIRLIEAFAPTIEALWVDDFNPISKGHHTYAIWNTAFAWMPEYGTVGEQAHDPNSIGWRYISNADGAPLLHMTRSNLLSGVSGRLFWAKDFAAPGGMAYDVASFSNWIDSVWRWVRRHGKKLKNLDLQPYVFRGELERIAAEDRKA